MADDMESYKAAALKFRDELKRKPQYMELVKHFADREKARQEITLDGVSTIFNRYKLKRLTKDEIQEFFSTLQNMKVGYVRGDSDKGPCFKFFPKLNEFFSLVLDTKIKDLDSPRLKTITIHKASQRTKFARLDDRPPVLSGTKSSFDSDPQLMPLLREFIRELDHSALTPKAQMLLLKITSRLL